MPVVVLVSLATLSLSLTSLGVEFPPHPLLLGSAGPAGPEHITSVSPFGAKEEHLCRG